METTGLEAASILRPQRNDADAHNSLRPVIKHKICWCVKFELIGCLDAEFGKKTILCFDFVSEDCAFKLSFLDLTQGTNNHF